MPDNDKNMNWLNAKISLKNGTRVYKESWKNPRLYLSFEEGIFWMNYPDGRSKYIEPFENNLQSDWNVFSEKIETGAEISLFEDEGEFKRGFRKGLDYLNPELEICKKALRLICGKGPLSHPRNLQECQELAREALDEE